MSAARIAVPNPHSCFPAIAVIVLELFNREGLDVVHELIFLDDKAYRWAICALAAQALPMRNVV